jgi:putative dimethyl sulfoxide reductase chaperone
MTSEVRTKVWWLLGSLFLERPNQAFVDELRRVFPVDREDVNDDERTLIEGLHAEDASLAERLSVEYTRLFRGISAGLGPPPPYESLYRGDRLMGQFAEAVRRHYSAAGFGDLVPPTTLPDHLGTELQFLALLSLREAEAEAEGAAAVNKAQALAERQIEFLDEHLLVWLPGYAERLDREAREPFYPAAGRLALRFALDVRSELARLEGERDAA